MASQTPSQGRFSLPSGPRELNGVGRVWSLRGRLLQPRQGACLKKRPRSLDPGIHVTTWSEHPGISLASLLAAVTRAGTMGDARCKSNGGVVFSTMSGIPIRAR
jgi:hypothetical protein